MGWSSGSRIMTEIIEAAKDTISDDAERLDLYKIMIDIFEDHDCDTLNECLEIDDVFDEAYEDMHPEEDEIFDDEDRDDWDDQTGGTF
jgi:hypothetical protein